MAFLYRLRLSSQFVCASSHVILIGAWFFNGDATDCGPHKNHSCCFLKPQYSADHVTEPSPNFAGGTFQLGLHKMPQKFRQFCLITKWWFGLHGLIKNMTLSDVTSSRFRHLCVRCPRQTLGYGPLVPDSSWCAYTGVFNQQPTFVYFACLHSMRCVN